MRVEAQEALSSFSSLSSLSSPSLCSNEGDVYVARMCDLFGFLLEFGLVFLFRSLPCCFSLTFFAVTAFLGFAPILLKEQRAPTKDEHSSYQGRQTERQKEREKEKKRKKRMNQ